MYTKEGARTSVLQKFFYFLRCFTLGMGVFCFALVFRLYSINQNNAVEFRNALWWQGAHFSFNKDIPELKVTPVWLGYKKTKKTIVRTDRVFIKQRAHASVLSDHAKLLSIHELLKTRFLSAMISVPVKQLVVVDKLPTSQAEAEPVPIKHRVKRQPIAQDENQERLPKKEVSVPEKSSAGLSNPISKKEVGTQAPVLIASVLNLNTQKFEYSTPQKLQPNPTPTFAPRPEPVPLPEAHSRAPEPSGRITKCELKNDLEKDVMVTEAFGSSENKINAKFSILSHEGSVCSHSGKWAKLQSPEHWATLFWIESDLEGLNHFAPVISQNTALLLAKLGSLSLQTGAGIVFGQIPAGWSLGFSGRTETALYFDEKNGLIPNQSSAVSRKFILLNADPGAHLLYMRDEHMSIVSVAVPVVNGQATYLGLVKPELKKISGQVLDGRSYQLKGLSGISVRVIGQEEKTAISDRSGKFQIANVLAVGSFPLYLESDDKTGYRHRYRASPERLDNINLFRFRPKQIERKLTQVEGGISSESGIVLAALPKVVQNFHGSGLYPSVTPLLKPTTLDPETYTLDSEERMLVHRAIEVDSPRFMAIQVPEGINLGKVEDKENKTAWSQLIISSPGIVNVVGSDE